MTHLQQTEWFPALKATFPYMFPVFAGSVEFVSVNAVGSVSPIPGICHDADDQRTSSVLRCLCSGSFDSEVDLCTISGTHGTAV